MNKLITLGQLVSAVASVVAWIRGVVNKQDEAIKGKVDAAPADGATYGQKEGKWVKLPEQDVDVATDKEVTDAIYELFNTDKS